jgi:chromosome partitioning protein
MAVYALWNNKGGVGKSYLTFQISSEFARKNPDKKVLVIDLCPQANSSGMLLGGMIQGEVNLNNLSGQTPRATIAGYIEDRIVSPYINPNTGTKYLTQVSQYNQNIAENLYLVTGDEQLELQGSRVIGATNPGPADAWRIVHTWISDLINDVKRLWNEENITVFIDCNPSFSIYTELALSASDRLIIPFSADGSSKRAVRAVLALVYGSSRQQGSQQSEYFLNSQRHRMAIPKIYCYVGNRLTQYVKSAGAFQTVVKEIGDEIWNAWTIGSNNFHIHPANSGPPTNRKSFSKMFQFEIVDANTASVVSSTLGIPIMSLTAGLKTIANQNPVTVNQSQLDKQQPNIKDLVAMIE